MFKKLLLAGVLGGLALFAWESIAHMALPLGEAGIRGFADHEAPMLAAMKEHIKEPGFYYFPAPEDKPGQAQSRTRERRPGPPQRAYEPPWS